MPFTTFCGKPQAAPLFGSAGGAGPVSNDAEFIFAQPIATGTCAALKLPVAYPNFQVNNGFGRAHPPLLSPKPLNGPTANHAYSFAVVGQGKPLGLELVDPDTRDDYGSFQITIRHAVGSDCAHGQWKAFAVKKQDDLCRRHGEHARRGPEAREGEAADDTAEADRAHRA